MQVWSAEWFEKRKKFRELGIITEGVLAKATEQAKQKDREWANAEAMLSSLEYKIPYDRREQLYNIYTYYESLKKARMNERKKDE